MIELIKYVVNCFAEKPEEVEYDIVENGSEVSVTVILADSDMGKVIGRQGKIAKALSRRFHLPHFEVSISFPHNLHLPKVVSFVLC